MRIELKPPVEVTQVDEEAEILVVAGCCALGFVGPGHPPHVLSLVDGCDLSLAGVAVDDLLVAINSDDPRDLERTQVVKALQTANSLEFRRPKPILVPASAAKNPVEEEESGGEDAGDLSAKDDPVVEISDEEKLEEDVEVPRPKKVKLVPRVKLKKASQRTADLARHESSEPERSPDQLEEAEGEHDAPMEMARPRKAGALRPLAVLKAALRRQPGKHAEGADRWRARHGGQQPEANETGRWTGSPHPHSSTWQSPHGSTHVPLPLQYSQAPSQNAPPSQWEAQWGWHQYHQSSAASSASAASAKGRGTGYRVEQRDRPRLEPNPSGGASLVVDHLDPAVHTYDSLLTYFRSFGVVKEVKLNIRRDEAVVHFRAVEAAEAALTKAVLNNSSIGLRPWIPSRRGQRSPFDAADAVSYWSYTSAVEAKTKAAVSDEARLRDTPSDGLDGSTASASPSAGSPAGGRMATRALAQDGNMQLESGQALEKKRKRDDLEHQKKELLQKYTDQLKIVMAKVNDPQTLEDHKEKLQTMLHSLQAKILAMRPEPKMRRETPPPSPAQPQAQDPEAPAVLDLDLPPSVLADAEQEDEVEPTKADEGLC